MTKYYFNWHDLLLKSKKDYDSIIILTYASTFGYNKKIANSRTTLVSNLNISRISGDISNYLKMTKNLELFNRYIVEEPQSYFINRGFLTTITPVIKKIQYLWLLSNRNNDNYDNYIYRDMFSIKEIDGIKNNPFINITENKIIFIF